MLQVVDPAQVVQPPVLGRRVAGRCDLFSTDQPGALPVSVQGDVPHGLYAFTTTQCCSCLDHYGARRGATLSILGVGKRGENITPSVNIKRDVTNIYIFFPLELFGAKHVANLVTL